MADPSAPPACFSCQCQNQSHNCSICHRPGFASTERFPPRYPPHGPPPYLPTPGPPHCHPPHLPPPGPPHCPPPHHSPNHPPPPSPGFYPPNSSHLPHPHRPQPPFINNPPRLPPSGIPPAYQPHPPPQIQRSTNKPTQQSGRLPHSAYYWVDTMARGGVPTTAIRGGTDIDGHEIYVGRAFHEGDWLPAKIVPGRGQAYVAYGGSEHCVDQFQVLCEQRFDWVPADGGHIPPGAVEGGKTSDGESLYIGRAHHEGSVTIGKIHPSHGTCYIPFGGREIGYAEYEVLVLRG